jgi:hypothetical protein
MIILVTTKGLGTMFFWPIVSIIVKVRNWTNQEYSSEWRDLLVNQILDFFP